MGIEKCANELTEVYYLTDYCCTYGGLLTGGFKLSGPVTVKFKDANGLISSWSNCQGNPTYKTMVSYYRLCKTCYLYGEKYDSAKYRYTEEYIYLDNVSSVTINKDSLVGTVSSYDERGLPIKSEVKVVSITRGQIRIM